MHPHCPDACLLLRLVNSPRELTVVVFIEVDRSTESMKRIRRELEVYRVYWRRERYAAALGVAAMRVLFVLGEICTDRRLDSMRQELARMAAAHEERGGRPRHWRGSSASPAGRWRACPHGRRLSAPGAPSGRADPGRRVVPPPRVRPVAPPWETAIPASAMPSSNDRLMDRRCACVLPSPVPGRAGAAGGAPEPAPGASTP